MEKEEYYAKGKVTVGTIQQFVDGKIKTYHVGKLRGVIVSSSQGWRFYSAEEARKNATAFRQSCRDAINKS